MRAVAIGILVALSPGCDGGSVDSLDAHENSVDAPPPHSVELLTLGGVEDLRYRDGDGPWIEAIEVAPNKYVLGVTRDYQVIGGCGDDITFDVSLLSATYADGDFQIMVCLLSEASTPPVLHQVTTQMQQAGSVDMDGYAASQMAPWDVSLGVREGTHDLVALGNQRILIRRGIVVSGDRSLPTIDVDAAGTALRHVPLFVSTLEGGETVSSEVALFLQDGASTIPGVGATALLPPWSLLSGNDFMFLDVTASTGTTERSVSTEFTDSQTTFAWMPALTGLISFSENGGVAEMSWESLPDHTVTDFWVSSDVAMIRVSATRGWVDAVGARSIGFTETPADWNSSWTLDLDAPYSRYVEVTNRAGAIWYSTSLFDDANGSAARDLSTRSRQLRRTARDARRASLGNLNEGLVSARQGPSRAPDPSRSAHPAP